MRSARPLTAGSIRRTTTGFDQVVKTFFEWMQAEYTKQATCDGTDRLLPTYRPLASGEGSS